MADFTRRSMTAAHFLACTHARGAILRCVPRGGSVLDFGCRSSRLAANLAQHGYSVAVHDRDAKAKQAQLGNAAMDGVDLEWSDSPLDGSRLFDGVTALWVLQHNSQEEIERLALAIHAAIKPGGVFVYVASLAPIGQPFWQSERADPQWVLDMPTHQKLVLGKFPSVSVHPFWYVHNTPNGEFVEAGDPRANAISAVCRKGGAR